MVLSFHLNRDAVALRPYEQRPDVYVCVCVKCIKKNYKKEKTAKKRKEKIYFKKKG